MKGSAFFLISYLSTESVSKKTSKKRIERGAESPYDRNRASWFQRKPQKRGLKAEFCVFMAVPDILVSKKTSKKRIESHLYAPRPNRIGNIVSKKTSKKRIERLKPPPSPQVITKSLFQRKPQKRGLKVLLRNFFLLNFSFPCFKENLKKED